MSTDEELDVFEAKNRLSGIGLVRDPHERLSELRAQCPVHQGSVSGQFGIPGLDTMFYGEDEQVLVLGFDEAEQGFRDPATFSNSYMVKPLRSVVGRTILEMDPPEHGRYRSLIQGAFTKKEMDRWEREFVHEIVANALDPIVARGHGDLAQEVAFHYPITVIARAAALPIADIPHFYELATKLTNPGVPEDQRLDAAAELGGLVRTLIAERRDDPGDDLISLLCQARFKGADDPDHQRLTDDEIVAFMRLLVPAGAQTTYRTLTNLLCGLLTHPDQLAALQADRSLLPQAIEEGLRWDGPLISFGRVATRDTEIGGRPIPEGTVVNLCVGAANRDPQRWERPEEFDIFRPPLAHMAFGQGPHICLGIHFARMELRVAMEQILEKLPNLRLDPSVDDLHVEGCMMRTTLSVPCVWDPPA